MMCAEWISNAAQHAVYAMIYAYERSIVIMRVAKIPAEIVEAKVLESLRSRMDAASRRVYPRWKLMMREIGVCRQRIADAVNSLKAQGVFTAGTEEVRRGKYTFYVCYYEFPLKADKATG